MFLGIIPRTCFCVNNFRFYLAFENALCKDYVTEKIFNALRLNTIPVGISDPVFLAFSQHNNDVLLFFHVQPDKGGIWRRKLLSTASSQLFCRRKRICITKRLGAVHKWRHHFLATPPPPLLCDDVQSPIRWYLHNIRSSLAVCVYGCLPYEKWWRHLWTERRPIRLYLHYIT